jgi:predicted nucleic acid-binding Zn ribbon protein
MCPVHEFLCPDEHLTEKLYLSHKSVEKTIECPKCGQKSKKIVSQGEFHLKGGCWFRDGYSR